MSIQDLKKKLSDGDGYFKEDMKVEVGKFSLDALDFSEDSEEEKKKKKKETKK